MELLLINCEGISLTVPLKLEVVRKEKALLFKRIPDLVTL